MTALRTLIAALALTFTTAALAQAPAAAPAEAPKAPLATVYGTLNVNFQYAEAGGAFEGSDADVSPRTGISIDSSNIGVRGGADVAHGLKVVFQCETQASVDGVDTRALCNRNSRLGLSGDWGTVFYGNWDTPYKAATYGTKADDPFGNTDVFGFNSVFGSPGFGVRSTAFTGGANAGFDMRAANSIAYWSPKFSGASFKVQYGTNEERSRSGLVDPFLLSAVVNYDLGGLSLVGTAEYHEDTYGLRSIQAAGLGLTAAQTAAIGNRAAKDLAWKIAAGYELPLGVGALTLSAMLEQLTYEQENAGTWTDPTLGPIPGLTDYDRMAWLLGAKFRTGNHEIRGRYTQALNPNGSVGSVDVDFEELGAQQIALGYAYHLAKSTQVYAFYTQIMNEDGAQYTFGVSGPTAIVGSTAGVPNTPMGADPMAIGVGMRFAF